ncbi:uncharacterized protein [Diadema setosum]|uniref:uncharacterized protein isoform X2 n=1 Tax=Diadema setosum TaxID=31175 RepID=UPI003B3BBBB1
MITFIHDIPRTVRPVRSLDLLQDPVCTKCDHQFCNFCVLALLQSSRKTSAPCPLCKVAITKRSLTKNEQLDEIVRGVRAVMAAVEEDTGLRCSPPRGPVLFSQPDLKTKQVSSDSQTEARARGKGKRIKDNKKARNVRKAQPKSAVMIKVHQDENECSADSENELLVVGHTNIRSSFPNLSFDRKKGRHADFQNDTDLEREAVELLNALNVAPLTSTVVSNTSCDKDMDRMEQNESVNHSGTLPVLLQGNGHENKISAREDISSTEVPPTKILPPCGKENVSGDPGVDPYEFIPSQHTPRKIKIRDNVRKRKTLQGKKRLPVLNKKSSRKVTEVSEMVVEVATSENESRLHGNCSLVGGDPSSNCAPTTSKIHNSDSTETKSGAAAEALQDSQPVSSGGKIQDSQPVILNRNHGKKVFATAYRKGNKGQCKSPRIDPQERVLDWLVSKHPGSDESDDEHGKDSKELWDNKVSQEGEMEDLHDIRGQLPPGINVLQRTNHQDSLHASVNLPMGETSRASTTPDDASEHVQILDKKGQMTSVAGRDTGPSLTCIRESPLSTNDNKATQNEVGQCEPEREKGISNPKPGLTLTDFDHADMDGLMEQENVQLFYSGEGHGCVRKGFMETAEETFQDQKREMLHNSKHATSAWNGGQDMQQIPEHKTTNQMNAESCSTNIRNEEGDVSEKVALIKSDWKVALELAHEFGTGPMQLRRQLHHNSEKEMCTHGKGKLPKRSQRSTADERKSSRRNKKIPANVQHQRTLTEQEVCSNSFQTQNPDDRTKRSQKKKQKAPESSNAFLTNQQDTMKSHHVNRDEGLGGIQQVDVFEGDLVSSTSDLKVEDVTSPNQIVREQFQTCNSAVTCFEEPVEEIIILPSIPLYTEDVTAPKQSIEQVCGGSDTTESIELTSDECEEICESHDLPLQPTKQDSREDSKILVTNECQFSLKQEVATHLDTEMEILNSILPSHNSQSAQMDNSTFISTCNSVVEVVSDDHVCRAHLSPISADPDKEHLKTSNLNADYCLGTDIACDPTKPSSSLETRRQGSFPLSSLDMCSQPSESLLNSSRRSISHPEKRIRENDASAGNHEPVQNISDVNDKKSEFCNNLEEKKAVQENAFHIEDSQKGTMMEYSSQKTHTSSTNSNNEFVCSETLENQTMTALEKISSDSAKQDVDSDVPKGSVEKVSSSLSSVICISESEDQPVRRSLRSRSKHSQDMNAFQCTGRKKEKSRGKAESDKQSMCVFSPARPRKSGIPDEDNTETNMHVTEISSVSIDYRETSGSQFRVTRKRRNSLKQNILSPMKVKRQSLNTENTDLALALEGPEVRNRMEANPLQENFSENLMSECVSLRSQRSICTDDDPIDTLIPPTPPCQDMSKSRSNLTTSFGKQNIGSHGDTSGSRGDIGISQSLPEKLTSTSQISSASSQQQGRGLQSKNLILEIQTVDKESSKMHLNEDIIIVDTSAKQIHRRMTSPGNHSQDMGTSPVVSVCQTAVGEYVSTARELSPGAIAIKSSYDSDKESERRGRPRKLLISTDTSSDEDGSDTDVIQRRKQKRAKKIPALEEEEEQEGLDSDDDLIPCSFLQQSASVPVSLEEDGGEMTNSNTTVPARSDNDYNSVSSEDSCGSQFLNQTSASSILSSQSEIMNTQQKEKAYEKIQQLEKQMVELQAALATESHDHSHKVEEEEERRTFDSGSKTDHFGSHKACNHGTTKIAEMNKQADDQSQIKANYTERPCVMEVEEGDRVAAEGELSEPESPSPPPALSPHSVKKLSSSIELSESMHTVTTLVEQYRKRNTKKPRVTKRTWQNNVSDDENMSDKNLGNCYISPSLTSSCNSLCAQPTSMPSPGSFSREGKRKKLRILGDNTNDNFNQENCGFKKTLIPQKMTSKFKKPQVDAGETNELGSRGRGRHIHHDEEDSVQTAVIQTPTRQASKMPQTELIPSPPPVQRGTVMRTPQSSNTTHGSIQSLSGAGKDSRQRATSSESILSGMGRGTRQMSLIASGLNRIELRQVEKLTRLIDGCRFASAFNANTTHVIVKTDASLVCERTLKYFQGIAARAWVVSFKWVSDSLEAEQPLAEESYEVRGDVVNGLDHQGPRRSRTWDGPGFLSRYDLCCIGPYSGLNKDQLVGLCEMCGACTVQHPSLFPYTSGKTAFIVVEPNLTDTPTDYQGLYRRFRVPVISREWILDSIAQYKTQPILDYLLSGAEQPITDLE